MSHDYNNFLTQRRPSIVEIFSGYQPPATGRASASALAADAGVETITRWTDRSLQLIPSRFDFSDNLTNSLRPDPKVLARFLAGNFQHKDLIIIDCAPTESVLTHAAYHASGLVLIPVKPEFFATIGFPLLQQSLTDFARRNRGHKIEVAGVVINNAFYHGGNDGGPEKERAMSEVRTEAKQNGWLRFACGSRSIASTSF
jgi:chromosome partitioning protein